MRACATCSKGTIVGGGYSNRVRATKFNPTGKVRRYPNLQWASIAGAKRVKVCTRCIRTGKTLKTSKI